MTALTLRGVSKRFGAVQALSGVDAEFRAGEVHAVLGENGAGKSTLMNVIYGLVRPDTGEIRLGGRAVAFGSAGEARAAGIGMVHQEFALVDALSVLENLALSLSPGGGWRLRTDAVAAAAERLSADTGLEIGDVSRRVGELPVGVRQRVEILKALAGNTRVLILDEPTAVLTPGETAHLFRVLDRLRAGGVAVVFITHKLREVMEIANCVTVLRRGRVVATATRGEVTERRLAELMVGAVTTGSADKGRPVEKARLAADAPPRLRGERLWVEGDGEVPALADVDIEIRAGEICGVAGVDGNGQGELFEVLAGLRTPSRGAIRVDGVPPTRSDTAAMIAAGVELIPPDRQRQGLILEASVRDNAVLNRTLLDRLRSGPFLSPGRTKAAAEELVARYTIRARDTDAPVRALSGGNQQRLVVARGLAAQPKVLVAFNPTRGLDVAAAGAVYEAIAAAAAGGAAVLLISTDLDEVMELSDRVFVLYRGRLSPGMEPPFDVECLGRMMAGVGQRMMNGEC